MLLGSVPAVAAPTAHTYWLTILPQFRDDDIDPDRVRQVHVKFWHVGINWLKEELHSHFEALYDAHRGRKIEHVDHLDRGRDYWAYDPVIMLFFEHTVQRSLNICTSSFRVPQQLLRQSSLSPVYENTPEMAEERAIQWGLQDHEQWLEGRC